MCVVFYCVQWERGESTLVKGVCVCVYMCFGVQRAAEDTHPILID